MSTPLSVLLVDDHAPRANAIRFAIDSQHHLRMVGTAATEHEALVQQVEQPVDLVLLNAASVDDVAASTEAFREVSPDTRVMVICSDADPDVMVRAARAGAAGFATGPDSIVALLDAIEDVTAGRLILDAEALVGMLEVAARSVDPLSWNGHGSGGPTGTSGFNGSSGLNGSSDGRTMPALTPREQEVLILLGRGYDPKAIARELIMSVHTARGHVKNVMMKLGAHTQVEAVVLAARRGLLRFDT